VASNRRKGAGGRIAASPVCRTRVPKSGTLSADPLEKILGTKPDVQDGMVKFTIGREATMHKLKFAGSMGLTTWAAFPAPTPWPQWMVISQ